MRPRTSAPLFSVVMTTYNRAILLQRALTSLLRQTEIDWEVIVVDDGSTDQTQRILRTHLIKERKFTYFYQKNRGVVAAKNKGMQLANGKYVTFLDSDDEYIPQHLETRKQLLQSTPSVQFMHGGFQLIGDPFVPDRCNPKKQIHVSKCAVSGTFFLKRELLDILKGFRKPTLGSDADFLEQVQKNRLKIIKTEMPTYIYHRDTLQSITRRRQA